MAEEILNEELLAKQLLEESLLKSDFTFGFELEACANRERYEDKKVEDDDYDDEDDDEDDDDSSDEEDYYPKIADDIDEAFNKYMNGKGSVFNTYVSGEIQHDGSVYADDDEIAFEWASPVIPVTPSAVLNVIKFLDSLKGMGISTNRTCGFHHHLSWHGITERDMIWTYTNLVLDDDFIKDIIKMEGIDDMVSHGYADDSIFNDMRQAVKERDFTELLKYYTDDKYRLFRIHPYGTIEWRGPRHFLDTQCLRYIKDFYYKKFNTFIKKTIEAQNAKTLFGTDITRAEFFKKLKEARDSYIGFKQDKNDDDRELEFLRTTGHEYRGDRKYRLKSDIRDDRRTKAYHAVTKSPAFFLEVLKAADNKQMKELGEIILSYKAEAQCQNILKKASAMLFNSNPSEELITKFFHCMLLGCDYNFSLLTYYVGKEIWNHIDVVKAIVENKEAISHSIFDFINDNISLFKGKITFEYLYNIMRQQAIYENYRVIFALGTVLKIAKNLNIEPTPDEAAKTLVLCVKVIVMNNYDFFYIRDELRDLAKLAFKNTDDWNRKILALMYDRRMDFTPLMIDTNDEDILKGIIYLFNRYGMAFSNKGALDGNMYDKIAKYIDYYQFEEF